MFWLSSRYDLLLVDLNMPELTGDEATKQLRDRGIQTPAVAVTANVNAESVIRCKNALMNEFVAKPVPTEYLLELVNRYVTGEG